MKEVFFILFFPAIAFIFLTVRVRPDSRRFKELLNSSSKNDVIVIFNPGGWGYTPLEKSDDFAPMVRGIKKTLDGFGYNPAIIPYIRSKKGLLGKITVIKEALSSFDSHTEFLNDIADFLNKNPGKKIIMAGLSFGAFFVDKMMRKISGNPEDCIFAIEFGSPFWDNSFSPENILRLNNNGKDPVAKGEIKGVAKGFFKIYFKWISGVIFGRKIALSEMLHLEGHNYSWPELEPEITSFLKNRLKKKV